MNPIKVSTAQFENKSGDKAYNPSVIETMTQKAAAEGSSVVAVHECSITGYSFARHLSREQLTAVAELVPDGPSVQRLIGISRRHGIAILAGLFEKDKEGNLYNTYVCVDEDGFVASFR